MPTASPVIVQVGTLRVEPKAMASAEMQRPAMIRLAEPIKGERVKLTAILRAEDADAASIWMQVDGSLGHVLRFNNMMNRKNDGALRGTRGWTPRDIVLDVPVDAVSIHFGVLLQCHGRVWARSFDLNPVADDVLVTAQRDYLNQPSNLDFMDAILLRRVPRYLPSFLTWRDEPVSAVSTGRLYATFIVGIVFSPQNQPRSALSIFSEKKDCQS